MGAHRDRQRMKKSRDASFTAKNDKARWSTGPTASPTSGAPRWTTKSCAAPGYAAGSWLVWIEHQAVSDTADCTALAESFGRGAMTNHWIDLANSDCVLIMGSNAAQPPHLLQVVMKAKERGASIVSVDPRFTQSSAKADITHRSGRGQTSPSWAG